MEDAIFENILGPNVYILASFATFGQDYQGFGLDVSAKIIVFGFLNIVIVNLGINPYRLRTMYCATTCLRSLYECLSVKVRIPKTQELHLTFRLLHKPTTT